jgi:hypothetical protein
MLGAISEKSPAFITFFGNSKERYIMLGKHRKSTLNTALGGIVCTLIGLYSLSSSPVSTAQETEDSGYDLASVTRIEGELYQARFLADAPATLSIFAPDQVGTRQEWTVVLGDTAELRSAGFGMVFFAPGPGYTITGNPSSDPGERRLLATSVTRPDGSVWSR